ncbi:MAG: sulfurtransferase-like selenium metabolism protein YedF [Deltaproteobacteria bacterium]
MKNGETIHKIHLPLTNTEATDNDITPLLVIAITAKCMGQGNDELGELIMKNYIFTLTTQTPYPTAIVFYNSGVKLTIQGSAVIEELTTLAEKGTSLLVCGTCLNYFNIEKQLAVGHVANMHDIVAMMSKTKRLVTI